MQTASIFKTKTFWLATIQAVIGIIVIFQSTYPSAGWLVIAKSLLDIGLRYITTQPVSLAGGFKKIK